MSYVVDDEVSFVIEVAEAPVKPPIDWRKVALAIIAGGAAAAGAYALFKGGEKRE